MDVLDLARWQFGITTVYHFILVPLTIGLSPLVAYLQTKWLRTGDAKWLKLSEFFGKILLINFALGVATGIVQEFQFGMTWSEYSRYVGDIFGAPLAFEALLAFFLESVFLGVWIFGRGRISPKAHTISIWLVALGTNISALFILAANSFMQNPVGAVVNPETGRAELDGMGGFLEVVFSTTTLYAFAHTISASLMVAGAMIAGISIWWIVRNVKRKNEIEARELWKPAAQFGLKVLAVAGILAVVTGHFMGQHMYNTQPTKMAAAMGIVQNEENAPLALLLTGTELTEDNLITLPIPGLESFMVTNHFSGPESMITGATELQEKYTELFSEEYGDEVNYIPNPFIAFYSFRIMMLLGFISLGLAAAGLWMLRGDRLIRSGGAAKLYVWTIPLPYIASTFGWILTEMGRQPWVVYPNMNTEMVATPSQMVKQLTDFGVSQNVVPVEVFISLVIFTLLYAALGVVWYILIKRYVREGVNPTKDVTLEFDHTNPDAKLGFAY
ncbi:cytochrome ubiquinol oxidase subunit I [Arcanobacterium pinnipediorum]|uniref:Cytochrome ubiquinol oxidase subunit I n=1 Tax=Arcanobacterium pinnipediorum TaxID=1503041 RepID=A0ABY5AHZ7_9ACTO|nr:cytochrome ubiquinol oxidase subunit I [Arcanobacterium pinnipediorum]USR78833.1 cytochrome ubiquinol oxidase subunit I [Arcanobacterium pinnipediorum]